MKKQLKYLFVLLSGSIVVGFLVQTTKMNGQWIELAGYWKYQYEDGTFAINSWENIDGERYYFDSEGNMEIGWVEVDENWYYLSESGALLTESFTPDGFYVNKEGVRTADNLLMGDGISYESDDVAGWWTKYYYGLRTTDCYQCHGGTIFEEMVSDLTLEVLEKLDMENIEMNTRLLNEENAQEGYQLRDRWITYSETTMEAIVIGEYEKIVDRKVVGEKVSGGTALIRRYNMETGKLFAKDKESLK